MSFILKILSFIALILFGCNQQKDFIQVESPNEEINVQIKKQKSKNYLVYGKGLS